MAVRGTGLPVDRREVPDVRGAGDQLGRWRRQVFRRVPPPRDDHDPVVGGRVDVARHVLRQYLDPGHGHVADPGQQLVEAAGQGPYLPHPCDHVASYPATLTGVNGIAESAARSRRLGATPAATSRDPRAATIAPLSVHSAGRGTRTRMLCFAARCSANARSREFAATPPPITRVSTPLARQASIALAVSTSQTASWKEAETSATGTGTPSRSRASTQRATA